MPAFKGEGRLTPLPVIENGAVPIADDIEVFFDRSKLDEVLRRKKPTRWFWCDMTDLFGSWVPDAWIALCFAVMESTPQHTHQILTKRSERMKSLLSHDNFPMFVRKMGYDVLGGSMYRERGPFWRENQWLGASVENQKCAEERLPLLVETPAVVRFLSVEPLLGMVDLRPWLKGIHLVIAGGESGPGARPANPMWFRSLRDQCQDAKVPFFFKQWGAYGPKQIGNVVFTPVASGIPMDEPWPMFKVGKKRAGRILDGRTWDEMPVASHYGQDQHPVERRVRGGCRYDAQQVVLPMPDREGAVLLRSHDERSDSGGNR